MKSAQEKDLRSLFCVLAPEVCVVVWGSHWKTKTGRSEVTVHSEDEEEEESDCEAIITYEFPDDAK